MSLQQFQKALSLLIRLPDHNRGEEFPVFLEAFDLTETEKHRLRVLSEERRVTKFGQAMNGIRWGQVAQRALPTSSMYIRPDWLEEVYFNRFEPQATQVGFAELGYAFIRFLLEDPKTQEELKVNAPQFVSDLLAFDAARARLRLSADQDEVLPMGSLLEHNGFEILHLNYDVPSLLGALEKTFGGGDTLEEPQSGQTEIIQRASPVEKGEYQPLPQPVKKDALLLLLRIEEMPGYRVFEVSEEIEKFLLEQRRGNFEAVLPQEYIALVSIGLCQDQVKH